MPRCTMRSGAQAVMSSPSNTMLPPRTLSRPNTAFIAVDLPAPLGPTMTTISRSPTVMDTPCRTSASP
jgi:hypothetical protein